jgi:hypothetical protein
MDNFAVLRVNPVKMTALKAADSHQMRKHLVRHIDVSRVHFNKVLHGSGDLQADTLEILGRYKLASKATTTVAADMILTAHHEYFDRISPDWKEGKFSPQLDKWVEENMKWLKKKYGDGLASVTMHLDETAVHLHAIVVPLATYNIKFRRGEKEVTRVNYRYLFADDMGLIRQARENKTVDIDTKLGRLQTEYANHVKGLGLIRGIRNSRAMHTEIKEYQRRVKASLPALIPYSFTAPKGAGNIAARVDLPPVPGLLDRSEEKIKAVMQASAKAGIDTYYNANKEAIRIAFAKAQEHDAMKEENERLKNQIVNKDEKIVEMRQSITDVKNELQLSTSQINSLRAVDMHLVAERLDYTGPMKWRNAIDMVKELEGMEYKPTLAWLNAEFGADAAAATAAEQVRVYVKAEVEKNPPAPLTKQQKLIASYVQDQLDSLDASHYRITMMSGHNPIFNVGKGKGPDGAEKLYTRNEVIAMVPQLERKNIREQYNVFITPLDEKHHYILLDDLTPDSLQLLRNDGYKPNLLLESSKNNVQAVFIAPKANVPKDVGNAVFKEMNAVYGDPNINGFVHPFRLAGFANVKDKHRDAVTQKYPFVKLLHRAKETCGRLMQYAQFIAAETLKPRITAAKAIQDVEAVLMSGSDLESFADGSKAVPDALSKLAESHYRWCQHRYGDDMNRSIADFMLVKKAIAKGYEASDSAGVLAQQSPDLLERHRNVSRYINDTITSAKTKFTP